MGFPLRVSSSDVLFNLMGIALALRCAITVLWRLSLWGTAVLEFWVSLGQCFRQQNCSLMPTPCCKKSKAYDQENVSWCCMVLERNLIPLDASTHLRSRGRVSVS